VRPLRLVATALMLLLAGPLAAAPLEPALQTDLLALYDRYNKAVMAGNLGDAAAMRVGEGKAQLQQVLGQGKKAQAEALTHMRMMTPDAVQPQHGALSSDGTEATLLVVASKVVTPQMSKLGAGKPGEVLHGELTLTFARDGGAWKLQDEVFGMDPAKIKPCHDDAHEDAADYDDGKMTDLGGRIQRVEFKPDHTLIVIRVVDEEDCLILPPREKIEKAGLKTDLLVPFALVEAGALPHHSDPQRVWVDHLTVTKE
jgi:hypothetical protein